MKTTQAQEVGKADDRTPVEPDSRPRTSAAPSSSGRVLRRAVIAGLTLVLIAAVTVVVAWMASNTAVEQPVTQQDTLLDGSIRARDAAAVDGQQDTLLDGSIRARER